MKKIIYLFGLSIVMLNCKKEEVSIPAVVSPAKLSYSKDVKSILVLKCAPCHLAGGTRANKYDDFATTKANISAIIDRVSRMSTATGFMPKGGTSLSADQIATLKQWLTDGTLE